MEGERERNGGSRVKAVRVKKQQPLTRSVGQRVLTGEMEDAETAAAAAAVAYFEIVFFFFFLKFK